MKLGLRQLMSFQTRSFLPASASAAASHADEGRSALGGPFAREQVRIRLSPRFNRRRHPDPALEASLEATWAAYRRDAPRLSNGSKFRLHQWRASAVGGAPGLVMDWGLTDYKTYLGTCCSSISPQLVLDGAAAAAAAAGRSDASADGEDGERFAFLSRKVGVAAVVETSDAQVALIQRSQAVGLYRGLLDTPGGHPEPSNIGLDWATLDAAEVDAERQRALEDAARDELFRSIASEVHEEINVSPSDLSPPLLLGVVLQTDACTPSFWSEVQALYRAGPMDKFESQRLDLLDAKDLLGIDANVLLLDRLELTPSARGTLALWQAYKRLGL